MNTLFIRIPRTGTGSIVAALNKTGRLAPAAGLAAGRATALDRVLRNPGFNRSVLRANHIAFGHANVWSMVRLGVITEKQVRRRFIFAFVRNPWARLISHYGSTTGRTVPPMRRFKTFEEHVEWITTEQIYSVGYKARGFSGMNPQLDWLRDDHGKVFPDFIGRFETLEQDWKTICDKVGMGPIPLPHVNVRRWKNLRGDYRQFYNSRTRQLVASRYAEEIEMFGYTFGDD